MSAKSIFIILISIMVTIVAMNNTEEVNFWFFGDTKISKLVILGTMFFLGWLIGFLMGKLGKKPKETNEFEEYEKEESDISHEDREYIN